MKPFAGCFAAAVLALAFTGCGDSTDTAVDNAPPPDADGQPAGLAEQQKAMGDMMLNPGKAAKAGPAATP